MSTTTSDTDEVPCTHRTAGERRRTARHEAGHALMAHLLGAKIFSLTCEARFGEYEGLCEYRRADDPRDDLVIVLGGPLAEKPRRGELSPQDEDIADKALRELRERRGGAVWAAAEARAEGLLTAHEDTLIALAVRLARKGTMSGEEVHEFLSEELEPAATDPSEGWEERLPLARFHAGRALAHLFMGTEVKCVELFTDHRGKARGRAIVGMTRGDQDAAGRFADMVGNISEWQNRGQDSDDYFNEMLDADPRAIRLAVYFYERRSHQVEFLAELLAKRLKVSREDVNSISVMTREHPYDA